MSILASDLKKIHKQRSTIGNTASQHPSINFIAISHSGHASTEKLLEAISGPGDTSLGSVAMTVHPS
jgi:hypothetical protein